MNLHRACRIGCYATVKRLINEGADPNATDLNMDHGVTPLHVALIHYRDDNDNDDYTVEDKEKGFNSIVRMLLDHGALVNHAANNGWTPLHIAASNGCPRTVESLLDHDADIYSKETRGWTPIFVAAFRGHFDVVQLLLHTHEKKQQQQQESNDTNNNKKNMQIVNCPDVYGQTVLMIACQRGHVDIVRLLLRHGAHMHVRDEDGTTALQLSKGYGEIMELLQLASSIVSQDDALENDTINKCQTNDLATTTTSTLQTAKTLDSQTKHSTIFWNSILDSRTRDASTLDKTSS